MGARIFPPWGQGPYCFLIRSQIYHNIGPLQLDHGRPLQYGQLYILDTAEDTRTRYRLPQNENRDVNRYVHSFKMMYELEETETRRAKENNQEIKVHEHSSESWTSINHARRARACKTPC